MGVKAARPFGNPKPNDTLKISEDVLQKIFSTLHKIDLISLCYVCKRWSQIVQQAPHLWAQHCDALWGPKFTKQTSALDYRSFITQFGTSPILYIPPCFTYDPRELSQTLLSTSAQRKEAEQTQRILFEVPVLGGYGVGKTSFTKKMGCAKIDINADYDPTICPTTHAVHVGNLNLKFCLVDFFWGCEYMPSKEHIDKATYDDRPLFVVLFSLCSRQSFDAIYPIINSARSRTNVPIIILGNKIDLRGKDLPNENCISTLEAIQFAHQNVCAYGEISCLTGENMDDIEHVIANLIFEHRFSPTTRKNLELLVKNVAKVDIAKFICGLDKSGY